MLKSQEARQAWLTVSNELDDDGEGAAHGLQLRKGTCLLLRDHRITDV